jgi:hypothetical protein
LLFQTAESKNTHKKKKTPAQQSENEEDKKKAIENTEETQRDTIKGGGTGPGALTTASSLSFATTPVTCCVYCVLTNTQTHCHVYNKTKRLKEGTVIASAHIKLEDDPPDDYHTRCPCAVAQPWTWVCAD